jgi:plastocyanin domain-containing protein
MKATLASLVLLSLLITESSTLAANRKDSERRIPVTVTSKGFEPASIPVKKGERVVLVVTRTTDRTCAKVFTISARKVRKDLPLNRAVEIRFTADKPGPVRFACDMDMVAGTLVVE